MILRILYGLFPAKYKTIFASLIKLPSSVTICALLIACGGGSGESEYSYTIPEQSNDGWPVAAPDQVSMSVNDVESLTRAMHAFEFAGIDSVVIAKDGFLVHDYYLNGYDKDTLHDLRSVTKSITSALVGIAIDNQHIMDESQPVSNFINGYAQFHNPDPRKYAISIENLLTMSSGLDCNDWSSSSPGRELNMYEHTDWVKFFFDLPMVGDPGSQFAYCGAGVVTLGVVVESATGLAFDEFANSYLFEPLGIDNYSLQTSSIGQANLASSFRMRPRDMAKFGQMFLQNGSWNGNRVVSEQWIEKSTQHHITMADGTPYGYLWWRRIFQCCGTTVEAYYASGNGGQYIVVFPSLDLVVVFTNSNYDSPRGSRSLQLIEDYILPAILQF